MIELFKNNKTIKKDLFEKIYCFENFRRIYFSAQPFIPASKINSEAISKLSTLAKEKLNDFERNKTVGQIKMSQQATCTDDEEMKII